VSSRARSTGHSWLTWSRCASRRTHAGGCGAERVVARTRPWPWRTRPGGTGRCCAAGWGRAGGTGRRARPRRAGRSPSRRTWHSAMTRAGNRPAARRSAVARPPMRFLWLAERYLGDARGRGGATSSRRFNPLRWTRRSIGDRPRRLLRSLVRLGHRRGRRRRSSRRPCRCRGRAAVGSRPTAVGLARRCLRGCRLPGERFLEPAHDRRLDGR
jgi:hypothetical protein